MNKWILIAILVITFTGGYGFSYGIQLVNPKKPVTIVDARLIPVKSSSYAFKVNMFDKDQNLVGVGYVPMYKIRDLRLAYTDNWKRDSIDVSKNEYQDDTYEIPTIDVKMITDLPVNNEWDKYLRFCRKLSSQKSDAGYPEIEFIP